MRLLAAIVALAIAGAALRAAASVIALAIVALALCKPMETLKLVAGLMCLGIIARFPLVAILTAGAVVAAGKLAPNTR